MTLVKNRKKIKKLYHDEKFKLQHVEAYLSNELSLRQYCDAENIARSSFSDWVVEYNQCQLRGIQPFQNKVGNPTYLSAEQEQEFIEDLKKKRKKQDCLKVSHLKGKLRDLRGKTLVKKGKAPIKKSPSTRTVSRLIKKVNATKVEPQTKTNARILAEQDPRHTLSYYTMTKAFI